MTVPLYDTIGPSEQWRWPPLQTLPGCRRGISFTVFFSGGERIGQKARKIRG
nr:MAG TPA: hypothetical protein [Caudoviricetes sp.]